MRLGAGEELVEEDAHGVHVGTGVALASHDELSGEVGDRPDEDAAGGGVLGLGVDRARDRSRRP